MKKCFAVFGVLSIANPAFADDVKPAPPKIDAIDVYVGPRKYIGKEIELKLRCYYADVEDYRCLAPDGTKLLLQAQAIEPKESEDRIDAACDTVKKSVMNDTCLVPLRFTFAADDVFEDQEYTGTKRLIIKQLVVTAPKPNPKYKAR